jgi:hypothetical protein
MVTAEFAPRSHAKVALENLAPVLMPVRAKRTRLVLVMTMPIKAYAATAPGAPLARKNHPQGGATAHCGLESS